MAGLRSSTAHRGWPTTSRTDARSLRLLLPEPRHNGTGPPPELLRKSASQHSLWAGGDEPCSSTPAPTPASAPSGHLMCYESRTSSRAIDTLSDDLLALVWPSERGDPMSPLRWTWRCPTAS